MRAKRCADGSNEPREGRGRVWKVWEMKGKNARVERIETRWHINKEWKSIATFFRLNFAVALFLSFILSPPPPLISSPSISPLSFPSPPFSSPCCCLVIGVHSFGLTALVDTALSPYWGGISSLILPTAAVSWCCRIPSHRSTLFTQKSKKHTFRFLKTIGTMFYIEIRTLSP